MEVTVLCYEKCSTCQKALKWLNEQGIRYEIRAIKEQNPTVQELKDWQMRSKLTLKRFFNTSGLLYKSLHLKERLPDMTEEEQLELLSTDGMLVKRPLLVTDNTVIPGFKEDAWENAIK